MIAFIICAVVGAMIGGLVRTWISERREFNGGACRCGQPWQHYDTDSLGGDLYRCGNGHWMCASWPHDAALTSRPEE